MLGFVALHPQQIGESEISGWQGRIADLTWAEDDSKPTIGLAWDSISLRVMPAWYIEDSVLNSLDWSKWEVMLDWEEHLRRSLRFPFEAVVDEYQEPGPLQSGDRLTALDIEGVDDLYGVLVSCRRDRRSYDFPLADLAAVDEDSPNAQPIHEYRVWLANR